MIHFKPQKTSLKKFKVRATDSRLKRPSNRKESNYTVNTGKLKSEAFGSSKKQEPGRNSPRT